jgi:heme-degrading monooxygenase HmoA
MYLHVELKTVPTDRQTEAIERLTRLHGLMAAAPGFVDAQICAYLGNPSQYLITRTWDSAAAHAAYRASPAQQEYARNRPPSLPWENTAVQEWESLLISPGSEFGDYVVRSIFEVDKGGWEASIAERWRHDAALAQAGGYVYSRAYRPLNGGSAAGEALVLERYPSRESYNHYLESAARADYERGADPALSQPSVVECYGIVVETLPG